MAGVAFPQSPPVMPLPPKFDNIHKCQVGNGEHRPADCPGRKPAFKTNPANNSGGTFFIAEGSNIQFGVTKCSSD